MTAGGAVAITGPTGRLGRALMAAFANAGAAPVAWGRPGYDLDDPAAAIPLFERDHPSVVVHAAAWTDVDGCTRDPSLANRRNGEAVGELAVACRDRSVALVLVSTNEVFDGQRDDGAGYREDEPVGPINAYGRSKLLGEESAISNLGFDSLWIVRTSWLYGPPGGDFPSKILAAADRLPPADPLRVVADEFGSPTFTPDLASAIVRLRQVADPGIYHLTNAGSGSRADWAARVLAGASVEREILRIGQRDYERPSTPPAWGVLDTSKAAAAGVTLRPWEEPLGDYVETLSPPR